MVKKLHAVKRRGFSSGFGSPRFGSPGSVDKSKLSGVTYPDGSTASYTYDWLGDTVQMKDRAGGIHQYRYDSLGRQLSDFVAHFGDGVDPTVNDLITTYDVLDRPEFYTRARKTGPENGSSAILIDRAHPIR